MSDSVTPFPQIPETSQEAAARAMREREHFVALSAPLYDWATERLRGERCAPWEWYNLMFLRDAIDRIRGPAPGEIEVNLS